MSHLLETLTRASVGCARVRAPLHVPPAGKGAHASGRACTGARTADAPGRQAKARSLTRLPLKLTFPQSWRAGSGLRAVVFFVPYVGEFAAASMEWWRSVLKKDERNSHVTGEEPSSLRVCIPVPHEIRDPHPQVTTIYSCEMTPNWTNRNNLKATASQLYRDGMVQK